MIWQLVVLGMALALNNTLASVALGAGYMPRWHQLRTALIFAVFEAVMPIIGVMTGEAAAAVIGSKARLVGTLVLLAVGIYSLVKRHGPDEAQTMGVAQKDSTRKGDFESDDDFRQTKALRNRMNMIVLAIALSLDNLTVGFGLGMFHVPLALAALIFGVVSLLMTFIGLEIGRYLGNKFTLSADKLSGVVLLLTAGVMMLR